MISAVRPAARAGADTKITDHHSAGIESRCHHLLTVDALAPMASAIAACDGHNSMIERKEVASDMGMLLGQLVLKSKANLSHDCELPSTDDCGMAKPFVATEFHKEFQARTALAREASGRNQVKMASLLGTDQGTYKQWESRSGSLIPHEYVVLFCELCLITEHWLFTGEGKPPQIAEVPPRLNRMPSRKPRRTAKVA